MIIFPPVGCWSSSQRRRGGQGNGSKQNPKTCLGAMVRGDHIIIIIIIITGVVLYSVCVIIIIF